MASARKFRAGGFTLIELLVAVSLLSVLLLLLFSAMRTGVRSWQVAVTRIDAVEGVAQVERFLVRIVSQARGRAASMASNTTWGDLDPLRRQGLFEGQSDRFVLVAPGVNALPPGLYRYEVFFLARSGGEGDLWVRIDPYRPNDQTLSEPRLLREDIAGFAVRYFSGPADRAGGEWVNEWPGEGRGMPAAMEIRIQSGDGEERPAIIAAPAVAEMA